MKEKISWRTMLDYGIGTIGKSLSFGLANGKIMYYLVTTLRMSKRILTPMFFFGRIWDGFTDLVMGTVIDNTHTRLGKFRPWILFGAVSNALVSVGLFWKPPGAEGAALLVYIIIMYLLWGLTYTMVDVSYYALIPAMTMNTQERDKISMIPRIFGGGIGIVSAFILQIIDGLGGREEANTGFLYYALITSGLYILTSVYSGVRVKENSTMAAAQEKQQEKFSLGQALRILIHNDQVIIVVIMMLLYSLANNLTNGAAVFYFEFAIENVDYYSYFVIIMGASQAIGLFGFPFFSKWFGRDWVYRISILLPVAGYLLMNVVGAAFPSQFIPLAIAGFITGAGVGSMSVMQNVMLADAVDYGEYLNGTRNEGIIFSMLTLLGKVAGAFTDLIMLIAFSIARFGGEDAVTATPAAITSFKLLMYVIPPIILIITFLLYQARFRLKPAFMQDIAAELQRRRGENAAQAETAVAVETE